MTAGAAPPEGRRGALGLVAAMAGFLVLAPPLFLLGPLLLLLVLSRPGTLREWLWIGLATVATVALVAPARGGLTGLVLGAGAAFLSGAFAVLSHTARQASSFARGVAATALAATTLAVWGHLSGIRMEALDAAVLADLDRAIRLFLEGAPAEQLEAATASSVALARLFPGVTALQALGGTALAWAWYHRVARHPVGDPPGPFREFRFNDHLIWGAIFTLGAMLLPLGDIGGRLAANGLVVWLGIYGARGIAIAMAVMRHWSIPARLLAAGLALLAAPFAGPTVVTLGLVDTWVDFRRRLAPPTTGDDR
jgi:hypothetical protein